MKIVLTCDNPADLPTEFKRKHGIKTFPFIVTYNNKSVNDTDISTDEIMEYVLKNKYDDIPKTAALGIYQYQTFFDKLLKGNDAVLHISFSSKASSAYNNAFIASQELKNVYIIDSLSLGISIGYLVMYAQKLIEQQESIQEIIHKLNKFKKNICCHVYLDDLTYLYKGGRCKAFNFLCAKLINIKPSIFIDDGQISLSEKYVSLKKEKNIPKFVKNVFDKYGDRIDHDSIYVLHTTGQDKRYQQLLQEVKKYPFKEIIPMQGGPIVSIHCGPRALGLVFALKNE